MVEPMTAVNGSCGKLALPASFAMVYVAEVHACRQALHQCVGFRGFTGENVTAAAWPVCVSSSLSAAALE